MEALTKEIVDLLSEFVEDDVEVTPDKVLGVADDGETQVDIEIDSLDATEIFFAIEKQFGVEIPAERLADILPCTVAELAVYVKEAPKKDAVVGKLREVSPIGSS